MTFFLSYSMILISIVYWILSSSSSPCPKNSEFLGLIHSKCFSKEVSAWNYWLCFAYSLFSFHLLINLLNSTIYGLISLLIVTGKVTFLVSFLFCILYEKKICKSCKLALYSRLYWYEISCFSSAIDKISLFPTRKTRLAIGNIILLVKLKTSLFF